MSLPPNSNLPPMLSPLRAGAALFASSSALALIGAFAQQEPDVVAAERTAPQEPGALKHALITGEGWTTLTLDDFVNVNGDETTWTEEAGELLCSGHPIGGARSKELYSNFELVLEWQHTQEAGNSGVFLWCPESAFTDLPPGSLPRSGIEVQVLDLGYETNHVKKHGKPSDWFTSHGDVFPVGSSSMTAFTPVITYQTETGDDYVVGKTESPRSFPTERRSHAAGEWNHYYIRAINGEVRLWVNGREVNGGRNCEPASGYLALEAEGAPIAFRNLRIRRLP